LQAEVLSPDQLETRADSVRSQIGLTLDGLRSKLTPRNFVDELTERSGVRELDSSAVFDFALRRHPLVTAAAGVGIGLCALFALRSTTGTGPSVIRRTIDDLSLSAKQNLKDRVEAKRSEFMRAAESQLSAGAEHLSEAVEKGVGELVSRSPAPSQAKPLIEAAVQIILIAAFESLLNRTRR